MRRPKLFESVGVGVAAAALIVAPAAGAAPVAVAAADPVTVFETSFEDGETAPFGARGPVTLDVTTDDARTGTRSLRVSDRADGWQSVSLDLLAAPLSLEPGEYDISAWVKLDTGTPEDSTGFNFTVQQAPYATGEEQYLTVGQYQKPVSGDEWVEIGGTYVLTEGRTEAQLYVDVVSLAGAHPSFLIDDIRILGDAPADGGETPGDGEGPGDGDGETPGDGESPAPGPIVTIHETGFETGTDGWFGRGDAQVSVTDTEAYEGAQSLSVTGRTANWHGPAMNLFPLVNRGDTYEISAWVKLPEGTEGSTDIKFTVAQQPEAYVQVNEQVAVTADSWVFLSGTYEVP
ncbi:carbohydrate binding domain-containing protein, partial [Cellulomonas bogoriensis]|uniref:carbohydrate binding domain-containing protein n=1 Tax=Cellulomonas bogoriensis TaxID=301388 RepID=UPI0018DE57CA